MQDNNRHIREPARSIILEFKPPSEAHEGKEAWRVLVSGKVLLSISCRTHVSSWIALAE